MTYRLKKFLLAALALLIMAPAPASAQMSVFDKTNNLMTLQLVNAGGVYFSQMSLFLPVSPSLWQLQSKGVPVNPLNVKDAAIYSQTDSILTVPVLKIDSTVYANVKLQLPATGVWKLVDLGDVMSTSSPGYDLSYPIKGKMPNSYCTDSGGELSYHIYVPDMNSATPQVWKHVADDPCCPLSVTTNSPTNISGISDVEIYPNPGEGPTTGNFRMMVTFTGKVTGASTTTPTCAKNVLPAVYPGNCVFSAAGTCVAETPPVAESTTCIKNVPNSTYAGTCSSPSFGLCTANPPTTENTCSKNVADSVYPGSCIASAAGTCVPDTPESCVVNVPSSVYAGGCFSAGPGLCNPTVGAVDYYSCVKNVPDSVYTGSCFSPEIGICNATTGSADNGYCTGTTIKRSQFCSIIDNSKYCTGTTGGSASKYCTPVNTPAITYNQYCSLGSTTTPGLIDQTGVETCIVRPVDALNYPIGANKGALAVSTNTVKAMVGQQRTVYVSGGLPPYFVTASLPGIVSYQLLAGDATGIGQALAITLKTVGTTQLSVFDYNGTVLAIAIESTSIPLLVSPSSIDVPEGTLIDVRLEGGVPPLAVYNPTPAWVDAPATIDSTPTTLTIAMKKSSGSSTTFLRFTDSVGTQASIGSIKISANPGGTTVLPNSITLKVGEYYDLYVTGGAAPITIRNPNTTLMDIPASLTSTPGTVRVLAKASTGGVAVPIYFTDKYGIINIVNVTITNIPLLISPSSLTLQVGQYYDLYVSGGTAPITIQNPRTTVMDIPGSLAATPGTVRVLAKASTGGAAVPVEFTDKNGNLITVNITITNIPLMVSPSTIDVTEGTLVDVRLEGGVPPLTVYNPTPDWVDAPATVPSTPTTIRIAMKKSSGSSTTFLRFTDSAGTQAAISSIKISASTAGTTVLPNAMALKVGESSVFYVTGGAAPISILNTRSDLIDIPASLAATPGTVKVTAKKITLGSVPIYFTDKYGIVNTVSVTISPSDLVVQPLSITLKIGEYYDLYVTGGNAPITILNPNATLMDVPASLATTPGTVRVTARKGTSGQVPIYFTDSTGSTQSVNVTISANTPILQ